MLADTKTMEKDVVKQANKYAEPSTMGQVLIERTPGAKAIQFDPFEASKRGAQEVFLDFYVTPKAKGVQMLVQKIKQKYRNGNKTQREAARALELAVAELLRNTYFRSFSQSNNNIGIKLLKFIERNSYRLLLGSLPRFGADILGNAAMMFEQTPKVINDAYNKYFNVWR